LRLFASQNADSIAPSHQAIAVVLDLMNPVGPSRRLVGGLGRHGSMKPVGADRVRELNKDMAGKIV
jgi:hypothetical protein